MPKSTPRFVAYEISPCITEHTHHNENNDFVRREFQAVETTKGLSFRQKQHLIFTLYGEGPDGLAEALVDRSTWDDIVRVYEAITGCQVPRKARNTRLKHLPTERSASGKTTQPAG